MKTINIKGKEYVTVNERLKEFRNMFKDYSLTSEIIELGADFFRTGRAGAIAIDCDKEYLVRQAVHIHRGCSKGTACGVGARCEGGGRQQGEHQAKGQQETEGFFDTHICSLFLFRIAKAATVVPWPPAAVCQSAALVRADQEAKIWLEPEGAL